MKLPNSDRAEVDLRKLSEYRLSPTHPIGKHKAAVFRAALGLSAADAPILQQWILRAAVDGEAVIYRVDEFGDRYCLDFELATASGRAMVRSAWIIRTGDGEAFEVEFCDNAGQTYGLHTLRASQVIALHTRGQALRLQVEAA
jgi:hypothetical protein